MGINRRQVLWALAAAPRAIAQPTAPIRVRAFNHMTLTVSDLQRSVEFYQGLFGLAVQERQSGSVGLRIGAGPQHLGLSQGSRPAIHHFCMTVDGFDAARLTRELAAHGVTQGEPGPVKTWIRQREGTPELYLEDPDGIRMQLQDTSYCGGGGALGNRCGASEASPAKGLLAVRGISHFTLGVSDRQRSTAFYQQTFGMPVQARQGATVLLAVGGDRQFLTMGGLNGATRNAPSIAHGCLTMEGFQPDAVMKTLSEFGLKPRGDASGRAAPLVFYVSLRMEDRGGAKGGTPELYFTDPDGILMQIQDVRYCGGSGYLGEVCA